MGKSPLTAKEEFRGIQSFCSPSGKKAKGRLALPYVHGHLDGDFSLELQNALMSPMSFGFSKYFSKYHAGVAHTQEKLEEVCGQNSKQFSLWDLCF